MQGKIKAFELQTKPYLIHSYSKTYCLMFLEEYVIHQIILGEVLQLIHRTLHIKSAAFSDKERSISTVDGTM